MCAAFIDGSLSLSAAGANIRQQTPGYDCPKPKDQRREGEDPGLPRRRNLVDERITEYMGFEHPQVDQRKGDESHLDVEIQVGEFVRDIDAEKDRTGNRIQPKTKPQDWEESLQCRQAHCRSESENANIDAGINAH